MALETFTNGTGSRCVWLVECPFCEADLRDAKPAKHLQRCGAAKRALDEVVADRRGPA